MEVLVRIGSKGVIDAPIFAEVLSACNRKISVGDLLFTKVIAGPRCAGMFPPVRHRTLHVLDHVIAELRASAFAKPPTQNSFGVPWATAR
jgi:hypothetical protein